MKYSVVNYSNIDQRLMRLEAKFYISNLFAPKEYFTGEQIIDEWQYNSIYGINDEGKGYPVLRMNEFDGLFTGEPKMHSDKFSPSDFKMYSLKKGDILICRTNGNPKLVGKSALVPDDYPYVYESHLFKIRPNPKLINSATLSLFLNTKYGKSEIEKHSMQGNQANFSLAKFKEIKIPKLSNDANQQIEQIVFSSFKLINESKTLYAQAQAILLAELGLANWQPKHRLSFVKNASDVENAGRVDAEYFQPKYDEIVKAVKSYAGGWDTLEKLVKQKKENFTPKEKQTYKYIELANIAGNGDITDCTVAEGQELPSRARRRVSKDDVIVSSIEGSLSSIAIIGNEYHQALCSTGFHVIHSQKINPETLLVLLKSMVGQLQLKKGCSGTILTAINNEEFSRVILPVISNEKQVEIQAKVSESFTLRAKSKELLESAKRAVEMAIEEGEEKALGWLEEQLKEN